MSLLQSAARGRFEKAYIGCTGSSELMTHEVIFTGGQAVTDPTRCNCTTGLLRRAFSESGSVFFFSHRGQRACTLGSHFNSFSSRSELSLCYVRNERRPSFAVPSADSRESRSLCGSREGTKTFPPEELWVPVDKEGSVVGPGRVYVLVYSWDLCSRGDSHFPDNKWRLYK